jgi:hypothetical protein
MSDSKVIWELRENSGRRPGIDRRYFSYSNHIPERRHIVDRRSYVERRSVEDRKFSCDSIKKELTERRIVIERRSAWN